MNNEWSTEEEAKRLHARFDELKTQGIGQAEFARTHEVPGGPSMVSQHIKARRPMNLEAATAYAAGFKCTLREISPRLANEVERATRTATSDIDPAPALRPFRNVPVVGTVQGGDKGYLLELEHAPGHGDGAISYPARDHQSYAVRVRGDSMRPRIKAGEFIVVEPNHECQPGDDVVVVLKDGQRMVKELLYIRDGEATLGSINNGHANITVAMSEVEKMHYVAAIIPRGAFYKA